MRLVASDQAVLRRIDVGHVLADIPEFYWRGRALMTLLEGEGRSRAEALLEDYPGEVLFAVRRLERRDLLDLAHRALEAHPQDPNVVANAIVGFATLGERSGLADL